MSYSCCCVILIVWCPTYFVVLYLFCCVIRICCVIFILLCHTYLVVSYLFYWVMLSYLLFNVLLILLCHTYLVVLHFIVLYLFTAATLFLLCIILDTDSKTAIELSLARLVLMMKAYIEYILIWTFYIGNILFFKHFARFILCIWWCLSCLFIYLPIFICYLFISDIVSYVWQDAQLILPVSDFSVLTLYLWLLSCEVLCWCKSFRIRSISMPR